MIIASTIRVFFLRNKRKVVLSHSFYDVKFVSRTPNAAPSLGVDAVNLDQCDIPCDPTLFSPHVMGYPGPAKIGGFSAIGRGVLPRIYRFHGALSFRALLLPTAKHTPKSVPLAIFGI